MRSNFFKLFLLITVLVLSNGSLLAQYEWEKYLANPLSIHGSPGSWNQSVITPCVIFNPDLNRYEMWFTAFGNFPNAGIGFAYSSDGISWTLNSTNPVMTPSTTGWDSLFVGAVCVLKEGGTYKMWYTGWKSTTWYPHSIGYATSPDGINWTKHPNPVLNPLTGWESGAVGYPSVIKVGSDYVMFYTGEVSAGIALTGRAISTDGITWQRYANNPVLPAGEPGEWDQNNYLGNVIELNNTLYIYYTGETNPNVSGTAIGVAASTDMGITWTKYSGNPIVQQGTSGQWDHGWIETGCAVFAQNELKLYYDGGGAATGNRGRIGLAISDPLPEGTYTIGTGGNFATIQEAFNKLSTDGVAGSVTLELIDELYTAPTDTFGFKLNGPIPGAGPNSRVTIKPAENKNVLIQGSGRDQLAGINTSYVTIDGVSLTGPTTLTIHALYNNQFGWNAGIEFIDNSDHNILRNITFISDDINRAGGGPGLFTRAGVNAVADSNLIENNFMKKCGVGAIYLAFNNATLRGTGNIIRGNLIGSETDSTLGWGIQIEHAQNTIVENNIIQNLKHTPTQVTDIINVGINSYYGLGDIIRNNVVHGIRSSSGYTAVGILLSGGPNGSDNMVYNNMVYDIQSASTQSNSRVAGIQIWNQEDPKIYYNTVYLSGKGNGSNPLGSAALFIYGGFSGSPGVDLKNNIFVNTRDESPYCASAIYDYNIYNLASDYNDLYYDDTNPNNCLVRLGTTNYHTLADWQATGKDLSSITEMPFFIPPNLHIDSAIGTNIESLGIPIAGIDKDLDGQLRNSTSPDIGADEIEGEIPEFWQMQYSDKPSNMMPIKFAPVSEEVCWATAYSRTPPHSGTYLRTTNGGINWTYNKITGTENFRSDWIYAKDINTAYIVTGKVGSTGHTGIYKTTDGGFSWQKHPTAFLNSFWEICYIHFFDENNGVAIGQPKSYTDDYYEIYTTSNDGIDWIRVPDANIPPANPVAYVSYPGMSAFGNCIWVPTVTNSPNLGNPRIFKSTDKGYTWSVSEINLPNSSSKQYWLGLAFESETTGILTAGYSTSTEAIIKKTTDGGNTWFDITDPLYLIPANCICVIPGLSGGYVVAGGVNNGTAYTIDSGNSWTLINDKPNYIQTFYSNEIGWSIEYPSDRICKYIGPAIISSIKDDEIAQPTEFVLEQNYPNPFNPSTTFRYSIPTQSKVVIKVFDILGNEIATLLDEEKTVGTYELTWDAASLPSGVYFYQLRATPNGGQAGGYLETKKMLLLK